MTEKLYYEDAYKKEFKATIEEAAEEEKGFRVRLDRTAFYPEGGGQGADHGILELADGRMLQVFDVQELEGEVWHYVKWCAGEAGRAAVSSSADNQAEQAAVESSAGEAVPCASKVITEEKSCTKESLAISPGTPVHGRIDWDRRFDHMQQHSGEHIVSGMICRRFGCDNVGFHLGEDTVTIDFNTSINMELATEIEEAANAYIWEDHPFQAIWPTAEELKSIEYRSKKELEGEVRITSFPGADCCACCGTHVSGSAQVGLVKFISAKPFHDGTRLELLCGARAMRYLSMNFRENKAAAVQLSTSEEHTSEHVAKLLEEHLKVKAAAATMEDRMFHMWADTFRGKGDTLVVEEQLSSDQARALADLIADSCGGMAAVFARAGERYNYAVIKRDADISAFIKEMNAALTGRGGGRNGFAQGSVGAGKAEIEAFFAERA